MGFGPDQVDTWEPYQIMAVYHAWVRANSPDTGPKPPTIEEHLANVARSVARSEDRVRRQMEA